MMEIPVQEPRGRASTPLWAAALAYSLLTLAATWPLARDLDRRVAGDLGDPVLVMWVMSWVMTHLTRALKGDIAALAAMWDANIFHPEPGTLALSEHFIAQSARALPVWWATGNAILAYNLSVLLTFALTGFGTFLLARRCFGGWVGPFAAGVFAAFTQYRMISLGHLHTLSIEWLPLAMWAADRMAERPSIGRAAAFALCVAALNLSSIYLMALGLPFVVAFGVVAFAARGRLGDVRAVAAGAGALGAAALITLPTVLPYLRMAREQGLARPIEEVITHSATLAAYRDLLLPTIWVPLVLAVIGIASALAPSQPRWRPYVVTFAGMTIAAFLLSLGPSIAPGVPGPYRLLYDYVPGFGGLRVVHRYGAVLMIVLPVVAAAGGEALVRRWRVMVVPVLALTAVAFVQTWPRPFPIDRRPESPGLEAPPAYLTPAPALPPIYLAVMGLPGEAALAEFPLGDLGYDVRYMFFSTLHGRRLLNGYSGFVPPNLYKRQADLRLPLRDPDAAWLALGSATHAVVHDRAWSDGTGAGIRALLESRGARPVARADDAWLYALPPDRE
ncbi:MAG: hypothetical protein AB1635_00220 [Acidobacteriota bacterium]